MNKKNGFLACIFSLSLFLVSKAQPISPNFFGENAWYTWYTPYTGTGPLPTPASNDAFLKYISDVKASGAYYCRIGGANANILGNIVAGAPSGPITREQILYLVLKIRAAGMEPIIQIPYVNTNNDNSDLQTAANNANDIVHFINVTHLSLLSNVPVKHWIIANEPDKDKGPAPDLFKIGYNYNDCDVNSPTNIARYIKQFAIEMRKADPSILIIGPELASYWHHFFLGGNYTSGDPTSPCFGQSISFSGLGLLNGTTVTNALNNSTNDISGLIGSLDEFGNSTGAAANKPYIDYISFHYYGTADDRDKVIGNIHNTAIGKLQSNLDELNTVCTTAVRGGYPLNVAITEANLAASNDSDVDENSFIRGQWWADFASVCLSKNVKWINYWSSAEQLDFGAMESNGNKRSTYWHFDLMQEYFKTETGYTNSFLPGTENQQKFKVFAANINNTKKESAVLIMNQDQSIRYDYKINLAGLGTPAVGGANTSISIDFGSTLLTNFDQVPGTINEETTQLLVFNCSGKYTGMWEYNKLDMVAGTPPRWIDANPKPAPTFNVTFSGPSTPLGTCQDYSLSGNTLSSVSWLPLPGLTLNPGNGSSVKLCPTGSTGEETIYTYIATDVDGCKVTGNVSAINGGLVTGTGGDNPFAYGCAIQAACNGLANGSAQICDASGVTWSNGQQGNLATGLAPGYYTASFGTHKVVVQIKNIMQPTISLRQNTCSNVTLSTQNQKINFYGTNALIYQWYRNGSAIAGATTFSYTTNLPGNYYVNIHSSQITCSLNSPTLNIPNVSLSATATTGNIPCVGGVITLNGTSTRDIANYSWTGPNGFISNLQNPVITNAQTINAGTYVLTVASGGCVVSTPVSVTVDAISVSPIATAASICQGSSTTLNANPSGGIGTLNYLWLPVSGVVYNPSRFVASPIVNPSSSSSNFTVRVTDSNGCFAVGTKAITVNNHQSVLTYPQGNYCASALSTVLPAMGQYTSLSGTFSSSPSGLNFVSNSTGEINLGTSSPGIYTITYSVPAANGCPASVTSANITINANDPAVIANAGTDKTVGMNCSATLIAGNYNFLNNYFWHKKGNSTPINSVNAPSVVVYPTTTTTYVLKVEKRCASFDEVTVNVNPSIRCFTKWNPVLFETVCASRGSNGPKEYSGVLNSDLLIADDTIWVTGNLKVTNNKRLDFSNSYIIISAGAKIEVQPGAKLNIDRSVLQTCDGSMWKGIEVMSNYNDPTQLSINNSLITNAETAVKTDKATDIKISGSLFMNGNIGINLDRNKGFNITESEFNNYDIGIKTTKTLPGTSVIARNTFRSVRTAVSFDGDDHSKLIIACNTFDYKDYAIKSEYTILKNQGTVAEGAGNEFTTTSTLPTNKLRHNNGNNMTYYYDPSNPVAANEMNTIVSASMENSKCELVTSRMMQSSNPEIVESPLNFKLYPNPNNGSMKFDYQLSDDQNGTIVIYDVSGRKISQYVLEHSKTTMNITEDGLQNGIYFYEVIVNDKIVSTNKIVIIK